MDTFKQHLRALQSLKEPIEQCNSFITYLLITKINENAKFHWESTLNDNKMPLYTSLLSFLEKRSNCSEFLTPRHTPTQNQKQVNKKNTEHSHPRTSLTTHKTKKPTIIPKSTSLVQPQTVQSINKYQQIYLTSVVIHYTYPCTICKEAHSIYKCNKFLQSSIKQRTELARNAELCNNCLGKGHLYDTCKGGNCRICDQKHHTYLHPTQEPEAVNQGQ